MDLGGWESREDFGGVGGGEIIIIICCMDRKQLSFKKCYMNLFKDSVRMVALIRKKI